MTREITFGECFIMKAGCGLGALLLAGCGGQVDLPAGGAGSSSGPDSAGPPQDPPVVVQRPPVDPPRSATAGTEAAPLPLLQAQVEDILGRTCGECHGAEGSGQADIDFIEDLDRLAETGLIEPGNGQGSTLILRILAGSMPPPGYAPPTDDEIQQIIQYLDGWRDGAAGPELGCGNSLIDFNRVFDQIQSDLLTQEAEDRRFVRYLSLSNRYNAGVCDPELDSDRWAMSKLLNSLSRRPRIEVPIAVDEERTLYRVDLRDYGWDEEIAVEGQSFADGWEAVVALSPYAVPFEGAEAQFAASETETSVPMLYADALLDVATAGALYYGLLGIPDSLDALLADLQVDVQRDIERGTAARAGTTRSGISRQDRLVQRHEIGLGGERALWQSFELAEGSGGSVLLDPLVFEIGESEVLFSLANGMQAYAIFDGEGRLALQSDLLFDTLQDDFQLRAGISCMGCHSLGPLQVLDEVRGYAESTPLSFDAQELEVIRELYLPEAAMQEILERDRSVYLRALGRAGVPTDALDPISSVQQRFSRDATLAEVAAELAVPQAVLRDNLGRLDPALGRLSQVSIDRDELTELFLPSLCVMQISSRNRPDDGVCEALR